MTLWQEAMEIISSGQTCALVTILQTAGSSPREAGTRMLVTWQGQTGTIGGGNLEYIVTGQARALLASNETFRVQNYPLGPLLAQCCGGHARLLLERLDASNLALLKAITAAEAEGRSVGIATTVKDGKLYSQVVDKTHGLPGAISLRDHYGRSVDIKAPLDTGFVLQQTLTEPNPPLLIFGAGHIGQAVARIAVPLPLTTHWYDERGDFAANEPAGLRLEHTACEAVVATAPANALYLVVTHSHALDYALTRAILKRGDFRYCGVIGSQTKRARFAKRLHADGITPEVLGRLKCPVGLIGLSSKLPEIIAVAIAAELLLEIQIVPPPDGDGMVGDAGIEPATR